MKYCLAMFVVLVVLVALAGCGKQSAKANLPEWAPKKPSPEFLRAAKVLKPTAEESFADPGKQAEQVRIHQILVPAWEFFGNFSDKQINQLFSSKEVRATYQSMTKEQQQALANYFNIYRQVMKDVPPDGDWPNDELVELYRLGAKEDLSNVVFVFKNRANNNVLFACIIHQQDGSTTNPLPLVLLGTI